MCFWLVVGIEGGGNPFRWRAKGVPSPLKLPPPSPKRALFRRMGQRGAVVAFLLSDVPRRGLWIVRRLMPLGNCLWLSLAPSLFPRDDGQCFFALSREQLLKFVRAYSGLDEPSSRADKLHFCPFQTQKSPPIWRAFLLHTLLI